jgi:NAD(P)-dependent dehydrogenase (short-subunit alcohol dehydrogenase family)
MSSEVRATAPVGAAPLEGKVALVTGGSRGLGLVIASALAAAGADVVVASRKLSACQHAAEDIARRYGRKAWALETHVGHWSECDRLLDETLGLTGRLDILVNNAGIAPVFGRPHEASEVVFDKTVGVNLKGPFRLAAISAAHMESATGGSIINMSAVAALRPMPEEVIYAAAKAGLHCVTQSIALEYGPVVRANSILAGPFMTEMSEHWDQEAFRRFSEKMPSRRGGDPSEIAGPAVFLASDASSFVTGALLAVDGGMTLVRQ